MEQMRFVDSFTFNEKSSLQRFFSEHIHRDVRCMQMNSKK